MSQSTPAKQSMHCMSDSLLSVLYMESSRCILRQKVSFLSCIWEAVDALYVRKSLFCLVYGKQSMHFTSESLLSVLYMGSSRCIVCQKVSFLSCIWEAVDAFYVRKSPFCLVYGKQSMHCMSESLFSVLYMGSSRCILRQKVSFLSCIWEAVDAFYVRKSPFCLVYGKQSMHCMSESLFSVLYMGSSRCIVCQTVSFLSCIWEAVDALYVRKSLFCLVYGKQSMHCMSDSLLSVLYMGNSRCIVYQKVSFLSCIWEAVDALYVRNSPFCLVYGKQSMHCMSDSSLVYAKQLIHYMHSIFNLQETSQTLMAYWQALFRALPLDQCLTWLMLQTYVP